MHGTSSELHWRSRHRIFAGLCVISWICFHSPSHLAYRSKQTAEKIISKLFFNCFFPSLNTSRAKEFWFLKEINFRLHFVLNEIVNVTFPPCRKESPIFVQKAVHMFFPSSSLVRNGWAQPSPRLLSALWTDADAAGLPWIPGTSAGSSGHNFGVTWRSYNHFTGECPLATIASLVCSISLVLFHNTEHRISLQGGKSHWPRLLSLLVLLREVWQVTAPTCLNSCCYFREITFQSSQKGSVFHQKVFKFFSIMVD